MNLYNSLPVPAGLRLCYWHPAYKTECQPFLIESEKEQAKQQSNSDLITIESESTFVDGNSDADTAAARLQNVEGGVSIKSPRTITSGLLSYGKTNHD